jgi:hypothetical protein
MYLHHKRFAVPIECQRKKGWNICAKTGLVVSVGYLEDMVKEDLKEFLEQGKMRETGVKKAFHLR